MTYSAVTLECSYKYYICFEIYFLKINKNYEMDLHRNRTLIKSCGTFHKSWKMQQFHFVDFILIWATDGRMTDVFVTVNFVTSKVKLKFFPLLLIPRMVRIHSKIESTDGDSACLDGEGDITTVVLWRSHAKYQGFYSGFWHISNH